MSRNKAWRRLGSLLLSATLCVPSIAALSEAMLPEALRVPEVVNEKTVEVKRGPFVKTASGSAAMVFPRTADIAIEEGQAIFEAFNVKRGQEVKAGDVLVTFAREPQTVEHETLKLSLTRAQEALREGVREREQEMQDARVALGGMQEATAQAIARLKIDRLRFSLEKFKLEKQREVDRLAEQLTELETQLSDVTLVAPMDGYVDQLTSKSTGDVIRQGEVLMVVYDVWHPLLRVTDSNNAFRYGMDVTITYGNRNNPSTFESHIVAASNILPYELRQEAAYVAVPDPTILESMRNPTAFATTIVLEDVLLVDRAALTMQGGLYYARIVTEDMVQKRYVITSPHRLNELWVLQGLTEGQKLLVD